MTQESDEIMARIYEYRCKGLPVQTIVGTTISNGRITVTQELFDREFEDVDYHDRCFAPPETVRVEGFYWIRRRINRKWESHADNKWVIAEYHAPTEERNYAIWYVFGAQGNIYDPDVIEIDERRIVRIESEVAK